MYVHGVRLNMHRLAKSSFLIFFGDFNFSQGRNAATCIQPVHLIQIMCKTHTISIFFNNLFLHTFANRSFQTVEYVVLTTPLHDLYSNDLLLFCNSSCMFRYCSLRLASCTHCTLCYFMLWVLCVLWLYSQTSGLKYDL